MAFVTEHSTALCLLQLGIGSRSRGIMAVNQIEVLDESLKSIEQDGVVSIVEELGKEAATIRQTMINSVHRDSILRVRNITKDRTADNKAAKKVKYTQNIDQDYKLSDAEKEVEYEAAGRLIDKPFQYYLFDPLSFYPDDKAIGLAKYSSTDPRKQKPRELYIQLLKEVRECIYSWDKERNKLDPITWTTYETLGRKIYIVSAKDRLSESTTDLSQSIYSSMYKDACDYWLRGSNAGFKVFTTHELRRAYVCYSYQYFGYQTTKEIGYAQYVLRHKSVLSTVNYTSLNFRMFLGHGMSDAKKVHNDMLDKLGAVEKKMEELEQRLKDVGGSPPAKKQKIVRSHEERVSVKNTKGELVLLDRLPRATRNTGQDELIEQRVAEIKTQMKLNEIDVFSKRALIRLGVRGLGPLL